MIINIIFYSLVLICICAGFGLSIFGLSPLLIEKLTPNKQYLQWPTSKAEFLQGDQK
jgi:hypothetical protein